MIPPTPARYVHDPLRPWRRAPRQAFQGKSVLWHTLWSETYSNPRYAELLPRLRALFFAPIRQRPGFLGRVDGGIARRTRFLERRTLDWYRRRGLRVLLTPSPWQVALFSGPAVVDLDDPSHTQSERLAIRAGNIEHVVVTTDSIADYVRESNPHVGVTLIPQGVDVDAARRANHRAVRRSVLERLDLPDETVIVGYHAPVICLSREGQYQSEHFRTYHVDVLLDAVRRLWSDNLPFLTLLVGTPSRAIKSLARSEPRLVLREYVDRSELFDWVGTFDIGAYPRIVDFRGRQSVKLLEYMASGAAIVAISSTETRFVDPARVGYVARDGGEFCARLRSLIVDRDARVAFGERGRALVTAHDWPTLAARYDSVLSQAVEQS